MKKMRNKKVLVTGGAGFIGSNLVDKLVEDGYKVRVIDNLSTGRKENLASVTDKIEFIEGDITNEEHIMKAADGVDYIFHQAALPSVQRSVENPRKTLLANSLGTLNVLDAAQKNKVKKVIYASSSSIYGERKGKEKKEIMKPQPLSTYAVSKLDGEHQCKVFSHVHKLPTICLRYFNVFGPKQNPHSEYSAVIPKFISLMLNDKKPVIFGDGTQTRDFTYVDNVVEANIRAAFSSVGRGETINIACGESYSVLDLVDIINSILGKNIKPIFAKPREGEVKNSLASIEKARKLISYRPIMNFRQGLEKTIEWYKENL